VGDETHDVMGDAVGDSVNGDEQELEALAFLTLTVS
jgi:hypothetical protein